MCAVISARDNMLTLAGAFRLGGALVRAMVCSAGLLAGGSAFATDYYVDNATGSDSNAGTSSSAPWSTFANVGGHSFSPGDTLNLATGCTWNEEMDLYGAGTAENPITVRPYGANASGNESSGPMAIISRNNDPGDRCIYVHNPNHWQIVGLEMANADDALYVAADNDAANNSGLLVYRCYFHDCSVSTSVQTPSAGIYVGAPGTLASPVSYLAGIQISCNLFNNCSAAWWLNADNDGYDTVFQMNMQNNFVENQPGQSYATRSTGTLIQDNWFQDCATTKMTPGGDTVVTTGLTSNMAFVNNVFDVVPDLGANDQTAVDEEIATTNQAYLGNVFYDTAGAGVEIGDIHGAGFGSVGSFFDGNLFFQNGWSATGMPDAVGTYESSGDTLTGALNNNLYYEPNSGFLFVQGLGDFSQSNNISVSNPGGLFNAALGFAGTQGANQWSYETWGPGEGWTNLGTQASENDSSYAWPELQYGDASDGWITNLDMCPPVDGSAWIGRVWTAPASGTISIRGFVQNAFFPYQGMPTGVNAKISGWSSETGPETVLWGGSAGQPISGNGFSTDLDGIAVTAGELIAFEVNNGGSGGNSNAAVSWNPTVYFTGSNPPAVSITQGVGPAVANGSAAVTLAASSVGSSLQWSLNGVPIPGATGPSLEITPTAANEGDYSVTATNPSGTASADAGTLTVATNAWLENLSARAYSEPGANQLIAGFATAGSNAKLLLIRGDGQALANFGIADFLGDPSLTLVSNAATLASTTGWDLSLAPVFQQVGAFALAPRSSDTALLEPFAPGSYTAQVVSRTNESGVALAEVFDADGGAPANRLVNLSARANSGPGSRVLIGGFVIAGTTPLTVVVRGDGPVLASFGLSGVLSSPTLTLSNATGTIATNSGWGNAPALGSAATGSVVVQPLTAALSARAHAFALPLGSGDSGMVVTLPPGAYTVGVSGAGGASGVALVEVYELR
jgi:hypothetical protein